MVTKATGPAPIDSSGGKFDIRAQARILREYGTVPRVSAVAYPQQYNASRLNKPASSHPR